jgi:DNA-binding GntR family transcriptional regulator
VISNRSRSRFSSLWVQAAGTDAAEPKQSRVDFVYGALREAILEQALRPGTKLSDDVIAEQFAVSRTGVRAALQQLRGDGLIESQVNKGASVSEPTAEDARAIFAPRCMLEAETVRRRAGQFGERDCGRLRAHVRQEKQARSVGGPASIRLAGEFHILLAELTGSPSLTRFVCEIVSRGSPILARFAAIIPPNARRRTRTHHRGLAGRRLPGRPRN